MNPDDTTPSLQWYGNASDHPLYTTWSNMKTRCYNPKYHQYHNYGGRGIRMCDRWHRSFWDFIDDVGHKPSPEMSLDRIDVNGNYAPENMRWATDSQQAANQRRHLRHQDVRQEIITQGSLGARPKFLALRFGVSYNWVRSVLIAEGLLRVRARLAKPEKLPGKPGRPMKPAAIAPERRAPKFRVPKYQAPTRAEIKARHHERVARAKAKYGDGLAGVLC